MYHKQLFIFYNITLFNTLLSRDYKEKFLILTFFNIILSKIKNYR